MSVSIVTQTCVRPERAEDFAREQLAPRYRALYMRVARCRR